VTKCHTCVTRPFEKMARPGRTRTCDPRLRRRNSCDGNSTHTVGCGRCHAKVRDNDALNASRNALRNVFCQNPEGKRAAFAPLEG
jgi:hypothetical protein